MTELITVIEIVCFFTFYPLWYSPVPVRRTKKIALVSLFIVPIVPCVVLPGRISTTLE